MKRRRKPKRIQRPERAALPPAAPPISIEVSPPRRFGASSLWMVMGALAAGAAFAQPPSAVPGLRPGLGRGPATAALAFEPYGWHPDELGGFGRLWQTADAGSGGGGSSDAAAATAVRFDIPAGPLAAVLDAFAARAGIAVEVAVPGIGELRSPGVVGVYSPTAALSALLEDTGLSFQVLDSGAILVAMDAVRAEVDVVDHARILSPRHTEPLVDTPQSITVVDGELIEAQGAASLRDVLRNVTGISIQAGEGGGGLPGDNLAIRGFTARNDIFVDGVRDFGAYSRDPYNVEQVEVAKGPASAYSGRGSTGGSINLATKLPELQPGTSATVGVGTDDFGRVTLDLNRPLSGDVLEGAALRLNAVYTQGDTPGRGPVANERFGIAPSFAAGLEGRTRLWLSGSLLREDNLPEYGIPWVPPTNVPLAAHADRPAPVDFDNFYGLVERDYEKTDTLLATAVVEHDLAPGMTLRALARGGRSERDSVITAPRFADNASTALNRQLQARDLDDRILDGQVDLDAHLTTGGLSHALAAGVEVSRETAENRARSGPAAPLADLFDPDPRAPYAGPIVYTGARTENRATTLAAYALDTVQVGPRVEVLAGARYDRLAVDFDNRAADGVVSSFGRTDGMLSWRSGVVFKPRPAGSLYAAYGTSLNPAAEGNTGLSLTPATALLEPEQSRSAEVGAKWEWLERRVLATAAVFETEKTNARTPGIDPGDPPTVLEGRQRVRGFEVGLNGRLADGWMAFAGYTYLDSEVLESNTPAEIGKQLANTPEHSFTFWTSYRFARGLELGGGAQFVDDRWNSPANVRVAPSYWKLDATAAYDVNERLSLRLNCNNLLDQRYIDRVGGGHFIPGAGRSASLTTGLKF